MTSHLPVPRAAGEISTYVAGAQPSAVNHVGAHWVRSQLAQVKSVDYAAGSLAAAGGTICCVWNTATHALRRRIESPVPIDCVSLSKSGALLAVAAATTVRIYRVETGEKCFEYQHEASVCSVHIGSTRYVASGDVAGEIKVHDTASGALVNRFLHQPGGLVVFLDHSGLFLVSESASEVAFIVLRTGQRLRTFSHVAAPLTGHAHCEGRLLIAFSGTQVRLFDCGQADGACFKAIELGSPVTSVDIAADQRTFLATTRDGAIRLFDMQRGRLVASHLSFTRPLLDAKFGRDDCVYAAGGEALVQTISDGHPVGAYCEAPPIVSGALSPDRRKLLIGDRDGGVTCYDLASGRRSVPPQFAGHAGSVSVVVCDAQLVASGAYDGSARLWRWDGSSIATLGLNMGPVQALALDAGRNALWVGTFSGSIACFDLATQQQSALFGGHTHSIRSLALSAAGRFLLVGDDNGLLVVRDLETQGAIVHRMSLNGSAYRALFDGEDTILVTTSAGVCRYRVRGTQLLHCYPIEHPRWFSAMDDGNLCALSLSGELRVFDPGTGRCVAHTSIEDPRPHRLVLPLGPARILTAGGDGIVRCYDHKLDRLAQMHHQYRGVLWVTRPGGTHPGWLYTDRPDLIEIGTEQDSVREAWTADAKRESHLMVFNSATHVMQVVNGTPSSGLGRLTADRYLPGSAMGTKQLVYRAGSSDAKPGLT